MAKAKKLPSGNWRVQASVVVDGNLITGKGPMATIDFALGFVQLLVGSDISESIKKGSFYYNR